MIWLMILTLYTAPSLTTHLALWDGGSGPSVPNACPADGPKDPLPIINAKQRRELLKNIAQIYANSGDEAEYQQTITQIRALDANLIRLAGSQAIIDLEILGNACWAQAILSYHANSQIFVQQRRGGGFALLATGRDGALVTIPGAENLSRIALINRIRRVTEEAYQASR